MVDVERVCCMCGDVGFPDKIFRCIKCHHRFQHSYCSNYYVESSEPPEFCDWCQTEVIRTTKPGGSSKKSSSSKADHRSEYSGYKIKQHDREEGSDQKGKSSSSNGAPSPKTTRRYKLLKDVMC
ncbi:hypothetical protein Hdeb2414_s0020g00568201 [Helianthus debilis subsp. tardiflorus]